MANNYPVVLEIDQPPETMSRGLWLIKWLLAFPHYIALAFLLVALLFVLIGAWVMILVTGRFPRSMFDFVVGVNRWSTRVSLYLSLVTDRYPPFTTGEVADYPVRLHVEYPEQSSRLDPGHPSLHHHHRPVGPAVCRRADRRRAPALHRTLQPRPLSPDMRYQPMDDAGQHLRPAHDRPVPALQS